MRFIICIEASHQRGMGHLFRGMHLGQALSRSGHGVSFVINRDRASIDVLRSRGFSPDIVDSYHSENWESPIIARHAPDWWINDRMDTDEGHARTVTAAGVRMATFDDHGGGAGLAAYDFLPLDLCPASPLPNGRYGPRYLVLDPAIKDFREARKSRSPGNSVVVTMGGSDTYGVSPAVVQALAAGTPQASLQVVAGPNFRHHEQLLDAARRVPNPPRVLERVDSLTALMAEADLVVCGGGVTLFEAAALGVTALTVANETHEIPVAEWFARQGFSLHAGFHRDDFADALSRDAEVLLNDAEKRRRMGERGMALVDLGGAESIISLLEAHP